VVEHGTLPMDELYFDLKPLSNNGGAIAYDKLTNGEYPFEQTHANASFMMYRIGDAVSSRNIHAAIYDPLRLGRLW
jgi:hypothetical protein